jgi:hypothetical protein
MFIMNNTRITLIILSIAALFSAPFIHAEDTQKDDFDAWLQQMNKQFEAERSEWEKRRNMTIDELRAQDKARWEAREKRYNQEMEAVEKEHEAARAEWEKRRNMTIDELRAYDDARWAEKEKQFNSAREYWEKMYK